MANEDATPVEEQTPDETQEVEEEAPDQAVEPVSEDDENTDDEQSSNRGDLRVALKQEREQRRRYEEALSDPNFIYEQAKRLGLTEEEAQEAAEQSSFQGVRTPNQDIASMVSKQVEARLDYEKAVQEFPEMAKDRELKAWAAALVDQGKTHIEAARVIKKRLGLEKQSAKAEGINQARSEITDKERAQSAPISAPVSADAIAAADLQKRMKSYDKKTQEKAFTEWIIQRDRAKAPRK